MPLFLQSAAEADLAEATVWYEDRAPGLGLEFLRAVEALLATLERSPELYPEVYRGVRRALMRRFPHAVYYRIESERVSVLGCLHHRMHGRRWQRRT